MSETEEPFSPHWEKYTGVLHCPKCRKLIEKVNVLDCEDVMTALIKNREGAGKDFVNIDGKIAIPNVEEIKAEEDRVLEKLAIRLPASELPVWSGVVNPALYGIKTHADFLNRRQRLVLLYLIDELQTAKHGVLRSRQSFEKRWRFLFCIFPQFCEGLGISY